MSDPEALKSVLGLLKTDKQVTQRERSLAYIRLARALGEDDDGAE